MIQRLFSNWLHQGTKKQYDDETNRRIRVVNLFALVGLSITLLLGVRALIVANWQLAGLLLTATCLFSLAKTVQIRIATETGRIIGMGILLGCLMMLMALLVVTGGSQGTGPLWIYIVPPVTMFFAGFQRGIVITLLFTLLIAILLFFPQDRLLMVTYSVAFKTRLLYSFLTVTFLSAFYEYSRQLTYDKALSLSEQFERQALHDPLTKLANRRGVYTEINREIMRMQRHGRPIGLILADIDHFKVINDTFGHSGGDQVLKRVAGLFRESVRGQDIVSRWGGEEFFFVLPETPEASAVMLADELRRSLASMTIIIDGKRHQVTSSFGVCELNQDIELDRALSRADDALYKAKRSGRNSVVAASSVND